MYVYSCCTVRAVLCIPVAGAGSGISSADRDVLLEVSVKSFHVKYHDVYIWRYRECNLMDAQVLNLLYLIVQEMRYITY